MFGPPLDLVDVSQDHRQQVVEIMGHAGGELAHRFQSLRLAEHRLDTFALCDLIGQLAVGAGELRGALLDPKFQQGLGGADGLDALAGFVLAPAPA